MITKKPVKKEKPFSRLTRKEKRIAIVKDAIKQLKAKKYIAKCGNYVNVGIGKGDEVDQYDELQHQLPKITCSCCVQGAILLSEVAKRDNMSAGDADTIWYSEIVKKVGDLFTENELNLMEAAFEKQVINPSNLYLVNNTDVSFEYGDDHDKEIRGKQFIRLYKKHLTELAIKAINFGMKYRKPDDRAIAILQNFVKHGTFKP